MVSFGELNKFSACGNYPVTGQKYCSLHLEKNDCSVVETTYEGVITRAKRKELGLDVDFLTTSEGCRKRDAINMRTSRSKTAGSYRSPYALCLSYLKVCYGVYVLVESVWDILS